MLYLVTLLFICGLVGHIAILALYWNDEQQYTIPDNGVYSQALYITHTGWAVAWLGGTIMWYGKWRDCDWKRTTGGIILACGSFAGVVFGIIAISDRCRHSLTCIPPSPFAILNLMYLLVCVVLMIAGSVAMCLE